MKKKEKQTNGRTIKFAVDSFGKFFSESKNPKKEEIISFNKLCMGHKTLLKPCAKNLMSHIRDYDGKIIPLKDRTPEVYVRGKMGSRMLYIQFVDESEKNVHNYNYVRMSPEELLLLINI